MAAFHLIGELGLGAREEELEVDGKAGHVDGERPLRIPDDVPAGDARVLYVRTLHHQTAYLGKNDGTILNIFSFFPQIRGKLYRLSSTLIEFSDRSRIGFKWVAVTNLPKGTKLEREVMPKILPRVA